MRLAWTKALALCTAATIAAPPLYANRLTFEVWPDASPNHAIFCSVALSDGWISLVQVKGAGMPGPQPMRWRASSAEVDALSDSLQAFVGGELGSVDPYASRQPPAPFMTVTWMTRLDDRLATGLYIQPGLALPGTLSQTLASLDLSQPCGLNAKASE
jgi:hypothetical protein